MPSLYRPLALICLLTIVASCTSGPESDSTPETTRQPVIYGADDRTDYYASESELFRDITRESIVALIPSSAIDDSNPDDIRLNATTLQEWRNLCDDQRFLDQPTAANCSGTLIDDDLVLTAGHCVTSDASCRSQSYVFDYHYVAEGELATISEDDVYGCETLVVQALEGGFDYAILQLDRPVDANRRPAAVRSEDGPLEVGQNVPVVGFGSGLPAKIDLGGSVLDARAGTLDYFVASTDTFGGNSGSGVFNAAGEVVGVLVRGETDYVSRDGCNVVNELSDPPGAGSGEDVSYVARAIQDLCVDESFPSARLCGGPTGEGWCDPCSGAGACPADWSCRALPDLSGTFCALPCEGDGDCRSDHSCSASGFCEPDRQSRCFGGDVWLYDACGRQVARADDCTATEVCSSGACQPRPDGDSCSNATGLAAVSQTVTGDMRAGYYPDAEGSCAGAGPDRVYQFRLNGQARFQATASGFDTVLYLRRACDDPSSELVCSDDINPPDRAAQITATLDAGTYFLFLDAWSAEVGDFSLDIVIDYAFEPPPGDLCADPTVLSAVSQTVTGDLADYSPDYVGSCGGAGPDRVYRITLSEAQRMTVLASGDLDPVLYVRESCNSATTERVCNDDIDTGQDQRSFVDVSLEPGTYYLFVDAWSGNVGDYTLEIDFEAGCEDMCPLNERRCAGDDLQICAPTPAGCGAWVLQDCGAGRTCSDGVCINGCVDQCDAVGASECVSDVSRRACSDSDGDGCLEWGPPRSCPAGSICDVGICVCAADCDPGERRCGTDLVVEECVLTDAACGQFVPVLECEGATVCDGGLCVSTCSSGCPFVGAQRCTEDGRVQRCGQWDDDDCLEWSSAEDCAGGDACVGDACEGGCVDECAVDGSADCVTDTQPRECADLDADGCLEWHPLAACPAGQVCLGAGVCQGDCLVDDFEPNDESADAVLLDPDIYADLQACSADDDWFAVGVLAGEELVVTVRPQDSPSLDAGADLDLEIYADETLELLDGSYTVGIETERLRYSAEVNEILLVRVFVADEVEAGGPYELSLTLGAGPDDECQLEQRRCGETSNGIEKCLLSEDGRLIWSAPDLCGAERLCEEGYCVGGIRPTPDAGGPEIDVARDSSAVGLAGQDVGCGCGVGHSGDEGAGAWLFLALGGLALTHRRRRRR